MFICTAKWAEQGRREGGVRVSLWTGEAVAPSTPFRCDPDSKNTNTNQASRQAIKQSQKCLNVFYINLILFHFPFKCRWNTRGGRRRRRGAAICNLRGGKKLLANENSLHCTQVCFNNKARWGRPLSLSPSFAFSFSNSYNPIQLTNCDVITSLLCILVGIEFISKPAGRQAQLDLTGLICPLSVHCVECCAV